MNDAQPAVSPKRGLLHNPWFWGAVIGLVTIPLLRPLTRYVPDPPPIIGHVPAFELMDQDGRPFGTAQLEGRVWVALFFSASCRTACPPLLEAATELQTKWGRAGLDVTLVALTVDPTNDTPARLRDVAREHGAEPERWVFLTGDEARVRQVVVDGFGAAMDERTTAKDALDTAHSTQFVLVDGRQNIRGYYGTDEMGVDEVLNRAEHVLREAKERAE